jgi:hypothetical protein
MMDISIFRRAAEQFNREKARLSFRAAPAPAPAPKKATPPPATAQTKPAPRTPTAAEREAERKDNRERREREYEKMMEFVANPAASPFAHLANYGAPEVELSNVEPFIVGQGSDASEYEMRVADPAATARAILEAGALARSGGHERPEPTGLAAQILEAGRKRRGLSDANTPFLHVVTDQQQPVVATAEMICRAAAKARGEIA